MITFVCNGKKAVADCLAGLPVLDWIREQHGLRGTKEGCREGDCGACTVVLGKRTPGGMEYDAVCSCLLPMWAVHGCHLVTIEGISGGNELTPFQREFYEEGASQCGFCTPGMIMSLTGFLLGKKDLTQNNAMEALDGNICRCTGYAAVRRAVGNVMRSIPAEFQNRLEMLVNAGHVPGYFMEVPGLLDRIEERTESTGGIPVAGGTDLYVHPGEELFTCEPRRISLQEVSDEIAPSADNFYLGAGVTVKKLLGSREFKTLFPAAEDFLKRISSTQIRSRATLGGNIMNGSPIADLAVLFLALDATVHTVNEQIPLKDFYTGYKQFAMEKGGILTGLTFPVPPGNSILSALKVCKREYLDIASVNSAALLTVDNGMLIKAAISAGGVAPFPLLLRKTSAFLEGRELNSATAEQAGETAAGEISPISDIRGSKEYKTELLKAQIKAHLTGGAGV